MDKMVPHMLGLDLVRQIEYFTNEAVESFEEEFTWLDEILETAKIAFQTSQIQTLPKTPSAKKRRGRKRKSEVPSFMRRSSIFPKSVDQSLNDSYDAENVPPQQLNTSSSYGTRATRNLRSRQKVDTNGDLSICNTSALRTRNLRNASRKNMVIEPELSPTKEISESPVEKEEEKQPQVDQPEDVAQTKIDASEDTVTKNTVTEQGSPLADKNPSPIQNEASPLKSETPSPAKPAESPEVSATNSGGESRVVNNSSYVIETPSEEESALHLPVISSPVEVLATDKPEAMDTDSGVNSDDKEQDMQPPKPSEQSDAKANSDADTECDTGKPSSISAMSSEEANQPPRTRTRTRKQQQTVPTVQLPAPYRESASSTTSAELNEAPTRMTRSRMRTKPSATTEPVLVPVAVNPSSETCDSATTENKPEEEVPRTRTRTRLQKRMSSEMDGRRDSEMKRQCTDTKPTTTTEKRRSSRLSAKNSVEESPEDADAEDSDPEDVNVTTTETWMVTSNYKTPNNLSTARSFLSSMNSSYMSANRTPSQKSFTLHKYIQQNSSFTGSAQRSGTQSRLNLLSGLGGNIKSLLKKTTTPCKGTPKIASTQEYLDQRKREFEEKRKKEQERLMKRDELQRMKLEERKKKREERMRKVAESRQLKEIQEKEWKDKKTKKLEEKLSVTDRLREEKLREEREKLRSRLKKQQEAEERRNQEDEERAKKLREQEEENQRHQVMLQRKKEYEEQERQRRVAEEKRKLEEQRERMLEAEKEKQNELERRRKIEEERERERQKMKEEREKEAARVRAEQRELVREKQKEAEEVQRQKLRELEQERLLYEQQMADKKQQREQYIAKVLNQPSSVISPAVAPLSLSHSYQKEVSRPIGQNTTLNTSYKITSNPDSYQMTPLRSSYNNYDIAGLKSDDSTDEEDGPRKPIPSWAQGPELKISLLKQYYNPPNLDQIFLPIELPDLNELFVKKKSRFNRRTSSAVWDSPMLKSHIPIYN